MAVSEAMRSSEVCLQIHPELALYKNVLFLAVGSFESEFPIDCQESRCLLYYLFEQKMGFVANMICNRWVEKVKLFTWIHTSIVRAGDRV